MNRQMAEQSPLMPVDGRKTRREGHIPGLRVGSARLAIIGWAVRRLVTQCVGHYEYWNTAGRGTSCRSDSSESTNRCKVPGPASMTVLGLGPASLGARRGRQHRNS